MKIIVDTSVWSLALRRAKKSDHPKVTQLKEFIQHEQDIFILGIILQEILQGISSIPRFRKLKKKLEAFPMIQLNQENYIQAARLRNYCRTKGINAGTIDFLIAAAAIQYNCYLLTIDNDFLYISQYSDLKLI
jgi:predicted nucleic acid-binding protein